MRITFPLKVGRGRGYDQTQLRRPLVAPQILTGSSSGVHQEERLAAALVQYRCVSGRVLGFVVGGGGGGGGGAGANRRGRLTFWRSGMLSGRTLSPISGASVS